MAVKNLIKIIKRKNLVYDMVREFIRKIYLLLSRLHITKPAVIVTVDGGLCSQMHQFMMGEILKGKGKVVEYDLSFFKKGLDLNNQSTRKFLINKLFPDFMYKQASAQKVILYKLLFKHFGKYPSLKDKNWLTKSAPVLLSGYYSDILEMYNGGGQICRAMGN